MEKVSAAGRPEHVVVILRVCPLQADAAALAQLAAHHVLTRTVLLTKRSAGGRQGRGGGFREQPAEGARSDENIGHCRRNELPIASA